MFRIKFVVYFLIFLLVGGIGIWLPAIRNYEWIKLINAENLFTYSVAIIGTLICEYLITDNSDYVNGTISLCMYLMCLLSGLIVLLGYIHPALDKSSYMSALGAFIVLFLWLFTYAKDPKFDKKDATAPAGGEKVNPKVFE